MTEDTMTIREMCEAFDVTPRTLRFYESKELLGPIRQGTRRLYTRRERARLTLILRGKRFGFSLEEIRQLLELYYLGDGGRTQTAQALQSAREHHARMVHQRDELAAAIEDLESLIQQGEKDLEGKGPPIAQAG
ncbi:MerR family transcriptional regulator [Pseudoroseicyclus tamaricis]|uniref:MerR family DNA-binding transcriptional regulator n=1 Tax=Pseudoroseicyclus tamaricis TaxID=2705421 RepID=A0A6B2JVQ2_9RHOB|nr:MerR family DNA-binding transcriptional regulator [Pseudoroseicyclus tamaricis]NDV02358.1 MerR family DNA-binding transcriptional regulator [Pseudoroseicyclus tamaricis]